MSFFSFHRKPVFPTETFVTPGGPSVTLTLIKHGSLAIAFKDFHIQVDPVVKIGQDDYTDYGKFPKPDLVLVTHAHYDHFSLSTIEDIRKKGTRFVVTPEVFEELDEGEVLRNGESLQVTPEIRIDAVPAYNTTEAHLTFHPKGRDNGYVLSIDGLRIYVSGDTEDIPEMQDLKDIDVAFLSVNQPFTMTPEQCAQAALSFGRRC